MDWIGGMDYWNGLATGLTLKLNSTITTKLQFLGLGCMMIASYIYSVFLCFSYSIIRIWCDHWLVKNLKYVSYIQYNDATLSGNEYNKPSSTWYSAKI